MNCEEVSCTIMNNVYNEKLEYSLYYNIMTTLLSTLYVYLPSENKLKM